MKWIRFISCFPINDRVIPDHKERLDFQEKPVILELKVVKVTLATLGHKEREVILVHQDIQGQLEIL